MKDRNRQRQNRRLKKERLRTIKEEKLAMTNEYGVKDPTPYLAVLGMTNSKHGNFYTQNERRLKNA